MSSCRKDCVSPVPGNATQVTAAAMTVGGSPSYRHFIGGDSFPTAQPISHGRQEAAGQPQKDFDVNVNSLDHDQSVLGEGQTKSQ